MSRAPDDGPSSSSRAKKRARNVAADDDEHLPDNHAHEGDAGMDVDEAGDAAGPSKGKAVKAPKKNGSTNAKKRKEAPAEVRTLAC